jgi:hypothetical protein
MTMTQTPLERPILRAAHSTCFEDGLANRVPATAPVRRPEPTIPEKEGSWPEPPPERSDTRFEGALLRGLWYTTFWVREMEREGLRRGADWRAEVRRVVCVEDG